MSGAFSEYDILDKLDSVFNECGKGFFRDYLFDDIYKIENLFEFMGMHNRAWCNQIIFSPDIKCEKITAGYSHCKTIPVCDEVELGGNPAELIREPVNRSDPYNYQSVILGEYLPNTQEIVLYYNAIFGCIAPIVCKLANERSIKDLDQFCFNNLKAAFGIVFAHEYCHACHHQNGDFANADDLLKESLAEYFELLYCSVINCAAFAREFAVIRRNLLKHSPYFTKYKGALTFDKLLGTQFPDIVKEVFRKQIISKPYFVNEVAPRYTLFRELFFNSQYINFDDVHEELTES
ncbi:MAG: hypothetical protein ACI4KM_11830 [Oscillospiraceae bacterium]